MRFKQLGLVVIDEQHRFGVLQRATLRAKGLHPDVLVMTATPIPRTLALTVYGDLDVSVIRDLPPGRLPVKTLAKPESRRDEIYDVRARASSTPGRQAYVIYPLVEESDKIDLKAATEMADHLAQDVFPAYRVGLLHGRMKADAKDRVMKAFAAGELADPRVDDGGRGRRRRAERQRDDGRARRAIRAVAAAPAARPRRPRSPPVVLLSAVSVAAVRRSARAAEGDDRDDRRLRDRRARSAAARSGRFLRHAAGGHADVPDDRSGARPRAAGRGAAAKRRDGSRRVAARTPRQAARTGNCSQTIGSVTANPAHRMIAADAIRSMTRLTAVTEFATMRVIAGTLKGRRLKAPTWDGLRPTSDKLRETLFNILAPRIAGARVLDGYAGTGALGIEAISRGAAHVTFVDSDRRAQALIADNLARCGVENGYAIIRASVAAGFDDPAPRPLAPFDIILLDPPYD